jgi:hypothetical protein
MRSPLVHLFAAVAFGCGALGGCSPQDATPAASPDTISACLAAVPMLPFLKPSPEDLRRTREALTPELNARAPELNEIYIDEAASKIVIGAAHPSKELCDDLHRRFGGFIEVVQSDPGGQLAGRAQMSFTDAD